MLTCVAANRNGLDCDEYPFRSTVQGGPGRGVSLRGVNPAESPKQGGTLNGFYTRNECKPFDHGTWFAVVPVPVAIVSTFSTCR